MAAEPEPETVIGEPAAGGKKLINELDGKVETFTFHHLSEAPSVIDGDDDVRPGTMNDSFPWALGNPKRATATYGKAPPDLSTMARSRIGGADYIYALLTGYDDAHEQPEGAYYNKVMKVITKKLVRKVTNDYYLLAMQSK